MIDTLELGHFLRSQIQGAAEAAPRSQQKSIGPSEVGTPCVRRIGYRLLEVEPVNRPDSWMATIGTAVHAWLANSFEGKSERYLVEQRVQVTESLSGSVDLYDTELNMVLDWKVVGDTALARYKRQGPGEQYRTQVQLYGMGFANAGYPVEHVGIVFLPRSGQLRQMHVWSEPYSQEVAQAAIERLQLAESVTRNGGREALGVLPTAESNCNWCPFYLPACTDPALGCPGAVTTQPNPAH